MGCKLRFIKGLTEELLKNTDQIQQNTDLVQPIHLTLNGPLHIGDNFYYFQKDCSALMEEEEGVNEAFK